jgi:hypothetical protein
MDNIELFTELTKRSLAFRIFVLLAKHGNLRLKEIKRLLDNRYNNTTLNRALHFLVQINIVAKDRGVYSLNTNNAFTLLLTKLVSELYEANLWGVFERVFLGSKARTRIVIELMRGKSTKTHLAMVTGNQGGLFLDVVMRPLIEYDMVIKHKSRFVVYELNREHPLIAMLVKYFGEASPSGNGRNNTPEVAKAIVDYIVTNWVKYLINPHNDCVIKITSPVIREIAERMMVRVKRISWLVRHIITEFEARGFIVTVLRNDRGVRIYVRKAQCPNQDSAPAY